MADHPDHSHLGSRATPSLSPPDTLPVPQPFVSSSCVCFTGSDSDTEFGVIYLVRYVPSPDAPGEYDTEISITAALKFDHISGERRWLAACARANPRPFQRNPMRPSQRNPMGGACHVREPHTHTSSHTHTHTRTHAHPHTRTHILTHTHTHAHILTHTLRGAL